MSYSFKEWDGDFSGGGNDFLALHCKFFWDFFVDGNKLFVGGLISFLFLFTKSKVNIFFV